MKGFGNICEQETQKITEYPIVSTNFRVKLIDCPGYTAENIVQSIKRVKQFINCRLIEFSNNQLEIRRAYKDPVLRVKASEKVKDERIHLVLWLIGGKHQVSKSEFEVIKEYLQPVCNIIPVVSMADTFS